MRRLLAILLLSAANQAFAQSGRYAEISSVSVDTMSERRVTIKWYVAEVVNGQSFAVYHWENNIWALVVDSLPANMREYQDVKAHPFEHAERYAVSTSITGDHNAPLSDAHQTVFLRSGDYDKCHNSLTLNWSAYVGADVTSYTVFGRKIGQPYSNFGSTADTTFATDRLEDDTDYNFMVVATLQNGLKSLSNIISYKTFKPIAPNLMLVGIDTILNRQGTVELHCRIDTATNLQGYAIWRKTDASEESERTLITDFTSDHIIFEDDDATATYRIGIVDFCNSGMGFGLQSVAQPIVVEADADAETVQVNWNYSFCDKWNNLFSDNEHFTVFCAVDGGMEIPVATGIPAPSITLNFNEIADDRAQNFCIRIEASFENRLSQSNTVCVERQADMWLPTAFTPNGDGLNDTFGPVVKSAQITDFEFIVYDRYGGRVFVSTSPDNRWDGTHSGKQVTEGGYLYYLKAKLQNGQTIERKGSVNVVYP
ncbi:MAG: gliding motility-associated C-terminal domain-containing protein [Salinivirgaceae bacterium]|nr:gliding motility-associated C-terminal domain-containing protein [Salinivirgaceae bacterium]